MSAPETAIATLTGSALDTYFSSAVHQDTAKRPEGEESKQSQPAYIGFRGSKSEKNVESLDAAGIAEESFYLRDSGEFIPLQPCDIHLLKAIKIYTKQDSRQKLIGVSFEDSQENFKDGYRAQIFATVVARLGNGVFVPATLMLRSGQTKALTDAMKLLDKGGAATDPVKWAARGAAHAKSAAGKLPGFRFFVRIRSWKEEGENGDYNLGSGTILPTPEADVAKLNEWYEQNKLAILAAAAVTEGRIADARKIANGEKVDE